MSSASGTQSPLSNAVKPPDLVPVDYRTSSPLEAPSSLLIEIAGEWQPVEGVTWSSIRQGRDGDPSAATLEAALSDEDLDAAGSIGARHMAHLRDTFGPNNRVRIQLDGVDPSGSEDYPLFEGRVELGSYRWDPRQQLISFELTSTADQALRHDRRAQILGQVMRRDPQAEWFPLNPDTQVVQTLPVVFNPGGVPNRSAKYYPFGPVTGGYNPLGDDPPSDLIGVPLFTWPGDPSARPWTVSDALRWALYFHRPLTIDVTDFVRDAAQFDDQVDLANGDVFAEAMTARLRDEQATSCSVMDALLVVCDQVGLHFAKELLNLAGTWLWALRFYTDEYPWQEDPDLWQPQPRRLDLPREAPFTPAGDREPADRLAANAAQSTSLTEDLRLVNRPMVLADDVTFEVGVNLVPGWLPFPLPGPLYLHYINDDPSAGPIVDKLVSRPGIAVLDNVAQDAGSIEEAMQWWAPLLLEMWQDPPDDPALQFHKQHERHSEVADVGRKWVLAEYAGYADVHRTHEGQPVDPEDTASKYHRDYYAGYDGRTAPWAGYYDWRRTGISWANDWVARPRAPLAELITLGADRQPLRPMVQIRFRPTDDWQTLKASDVTVSPDECAVLITAHNPTHLVPAGQEAGSEEAYDLIEAIIRRTVEVRLICVIKGDRRLYDERIAGSPISRYVCAVFDTRSYRWRERSFSPLAGDPQYPSEPWLDGSECDIEALERYTHRRGRGLSRPTVTGNPEVPYWSLEWRLGDHVVSVAGLGLHFQHSGAAVQALELLNGTGGRRTRLLLSDEREEGGE